MRGGACCCEMTERVTAATEGERRKGLRLDKTEVGLRATSCVGRGQIRRRSTTYTSRLYAAAGKGRVTLAYVRWAARFTIPSTCQCVQCFTGG